MKKKIGFISLFILVVWASVGFCLEELQMPIEGGYTLYVTRGYNTATHKDYNFNDGDDRYALDFASDGCKSWNKPILAIAGGSVLTVHNANDNGYGRYVILDHGGGYHFRYAHLNFISVSEGNTVVQGQEIGKMGNTGNVSGTSCPDHPGMHLHFALYLNGNAIQPELFSGYQNIGAGNLYTSMNCYNPMTNFKVGKYSTGFVYENTSDIKPYSRPFAVTYFHNEGSEMFGYPVSNVYLMENCFGCNEFGAEKVLCPRFSRRTAGGQYIGHEHVDV